MQTAGLYPIHLALSWMNPFDAGVWIAFLKLWIAGFFTFLYMRQLKVGTAGALLSGITFPLCGFMLVWLGHPHVSCICLLPVLLYFIELGLTDGRAWAGYAVAYGCMILGGHPPSIIHITLAVSAYFLFRLFDERGRKDDQGKKYSLAAFLGATAAGALVAGPQLAPFLEYYGNSSIALSAASLKRWAAHLTPNALTQFFLPHISGTPSAFGNLEGVFGFTSTENFNERNGFVGIMPLFLASVAVFHRRERWIRFYAAALGCCFWVIYGLPPMPQVLGAIPILNSMNPIRLMFFLCFSLAVLAGAGLDALQGLGASERRNLAVGAGVSALLVLFWTREFFGPIFPELTLAEKSFVLRQLPMFGGGVLAAVLAAVVGKISMRPYVKALCLAWTAFELLWFGIGCNPSIDRSLYYPATQAIERLRQDPSLFRIFGMDWILAPDTGIVYGLQDVRGQDFATVRRFEELMTGKAGDFTFYSTAPTLPAPLRWLNAKYVLSTHDWKRPDVPGVQWKTIYDGEVAIHEIQPSLERALLVSRQEVLPRPEDILTRVRTPSFDPRETLLLEEAPAAPPIRTGGLDADSKIKPFARVSLYTPDKVVVEAASPEPTFLLLLDTHYPGWKAYINDQEAKIYRADYNFRAVSIPRGRSLVRFEYVPWSFRLGLALAMMGLALAAWMFRFWRDGRYASSAR
jgi:hypothetical protein